MIAGTLGGICTVVNSTLTTWASSARIHKVTVWPGLSSTVVASPEVIWFSPVTSVEKDESKVRTIPEGVSVERPVSSSPPKGTLCSGWLNLGVINTTPLFRVNNYTAKSVIDVSVTYTLSNNIACVDLGITVGVLKAIYYLALDGPGTNILQPAGVPSTA